MLIALEAPRPYQYGDLFTLGDDLLLGKKSGETITYVKISVNSRARPYRTIQNVFITTTIEMSGCRFARQGVRQPLR
jgi:hypothetical protein